MREELKTKKFACRYYHAGSWWSVHIDAYDAIDADARVKKLGNLILDGELVLSGPAYLLPFIRFFCWLRNLLH